MITLSDGYQTYPKIVAHLEYLHERGQITEKKLLAALAWLRQEYCDHVAGELLGDIDIKD